jgi:hypothetical protein
LEGQIKVRGVYQGLFFKNSRSPSVFRVGVLEFVTGGNTYEIRVIKIGVGDEAELAKGEFNHLMTNSEAVQEVDGDPGTKASDDVLAGCGDMNVPKVAVTFTDSYLFYWGAGPTSGLR